MMNELINECIGKLYPALGAGLRQPSARSFPGPRCYALGPGLWALGPGRTPCSLAGSCSGTALLIRWRRMRSAYRVRIVGRTRVPQ